MVCSGIDCCPEWFSALAYVGIAFLYVTTSFAVAIIVKSYLKSKGEYDKDDDLNFIVVSGLLWPIALLIIGVIWIALWLTFPLRGATKSDLKDLENKLTGKGYKLKFKTGDIITGISSNPGGYSVLTDKSKCRVKSIANNGSMQLTLIDHKDFKKFESRIGEEFTAPQEYFKKFR